MSDRPTLDYRPPEPRRRRETSPLAWLVLWVVAGFAVLSLTVSALVWVALDESGL